MSAPAIPQHGEDPRYSRSLRGFVAQTLENPPAKPVKSNAGAGLNGTAEARDGASSANRLKAGEPAVAACPCCGAKVRAVASGKRVRLEIVRYTKPEIPWEPDMARGSRALTEKVIRKVCEVNAVALEELWPRNHDPSLAAIRRDAAKAARRSGAAASTIGEILHRGQSVINRLAPLEEARRAGPLEEGL